MRKKLSILIIVILVILTVSGCSFGKEELLNGEWNIGGIVYNDLVIDIDDNTALADLYDNHILTFGEENTFLYIMSVFYHEGTFAFAKNNKDETMYILKSSENGKYDLENETLIKVPDDTDYKQYAIVLLDENTIAFSELGDSDIETLLLFVRKGTSSSYINNHKVNLNELNGKDNIEEKEHLEKRIH